MKTETGNYNNCLIGRQPILNRREEVVAYELLFRSINSRDSAVFNDVSQASASVIIDMLSEFGLERIIGKQRGFINVDLELLMSEAIEILPKEKVVLELLETMEVTPPLIERCRGLREKGFSIALDDHIFDSAYAELYEIAEIIKIDLLQSTDDEMAEMAGRFRPYPLKLLAEKVETRDRFHNCLDMGFDFFQGYYFAKPSVLEKKRLDESTTTLLKLMRLMNEDAEIEKIEQTFGKSPALTYKLLLLVNSVAIGLREKIQTIRHAIAVLGRRRINQWVQLALFASDDSRGMRNPLVEMAAVRAIFMQQISSRHPRLRENPDAPEIAFTVGILSLLESIYDISIEETVEALNLSVEVRDALLSRGGELGLILDLAESMERSFYKVTPEQLADLGLTQSDLLSSQVFAYQWLGESF
jgi:EAL and modified HD-GYP domain-containing signal transduction protein